MWSKNCQEVVSRLSLDCPKVVPKLSQSAWCRAWQKQPVKERVRWREKTTILWDTTKKRNSSAFSFMTINDILEENTRVKRENQRLTDAIDSNITQLTEKINQLSVVPLGTIVAWTPHPKNSRNPVQLPAGWQRCDGSKIVGGIWHGERLPNINGEERFLRGTRTSGRVLLTEEDEVRSWSLKVTILKFCICR